MRLRRDHHRRALGRRDARDPLAGPHPRRAGHLLDAAPVRRAQHELVRALVVEVDEAGVGPERVRDVARDELQHLLEIERRVDRGDRVRQEPQVAGGRVHRLIVAARLRCRRIGAVSFDEWALALHVLSAFAFIAGIVLFWVLIVAVRRTDTPEETIRMEPVAKVGNAAVGIGAGGTHPARDLARLLVRRLRHLGSVDHRGTRALGVAAALGQRTGAAYMQGMNKARELADARASRGRTPSSSR